MSVRNTLENKRIRRAQRAIRKGRLPAYVDLVEWVRMRANVSERTAEMVIRAGTLRVDSHPLTDRYVLAHLAKDITIVAPKEIS